MTLDPDPLDEMLAAAEITGDELGIDELERLWALLGNDDETLHDEFVTAVARQAVWDDQTGGLDEELHLRLGNWKIDLTRAGVRAGLLSAMIAVGLMGQGLEDFGIAFVTAVLPSVVDIQRVTLSPGDRRLLVDLRLNKALREGFATEDELYAALPDEARRQVNRYDFADFIERLREAGLTDETDDGWLHLRDPGDP